MELVTLILGAMGVLIPFVIMLIKRRIERRDHVDTAIGKRDRDELRAGLDKLRGDKPVPEGSQTKL